MFRTVAAALARRSARHVVDATERRFSRFDALRRCPSSDAFAASTRAGMCHDARALGPLPGDAEHAVSDVDKFLFDTNGFVVVKDVFSKDDLRAFHDTVLGGGVGPTISTNSDGTLGCDLDWTVAGAAPNTPLGLWALSLGQTAVPLSTVFPACNGTVHVINPLLSPATVDGTGTSTYVVPMPPIPGLCGQAVVGQYVQLNFGACGVLLSDALAFTIGN